MKTVIDGMTVGYTDQGNGTPLVFIHAFPLSKTMWQPQVDALKDTYRVITIDLGGHGESEIMLGNDSLDGYAKNVLHLLDHLEIAQAVFVGPCLLACRWAGISSFRSTDIMRIV
jgi:pimeloyl-ACP methyl ester carboxylesterase